jgi:hypothetical protein
MPIVLAICHRLLLARNQRPGVVRRTSGIS